MIQNRKSKIMQAAALFGVASFAFIGCSAHVDAADLSSTDGGKDSAPTELTPFGTWVSTTDKSVELVLSDDGSYVFNPCAAMGKWSDEGGYFSAEPESMLDVGGCPETLKLARIDQITVNGDALIVSDSEGNKEAFQKINE